MSDLHRNPRHERLKAKTIALIKEWPSLKGAWTRIEKKFAKASRTEQKRALTEWVWEGSFARAYLRKYKAYAYRDARHIAAWLVEELNEGL